MSILTFKLVAIVFVAATGLLGGYMAVGMSSRKLNERFFSFGNAFGGGIFLGAGLIHMLPDARETFQNYAPNCQFPWVPCLCACGFLIVLFLEKVLLREHDAVAASEKHKPGRALFPYVLTLVLSVHSIIAGIAVGTEERVTQVIIILVAIVAHKASAAFALGVSLNRGHVPRARSYGILTFFSFMTPLGIVIGSTLTALLEGQAEQVVTAVFDALAAGTFLYVAMIDIIEEEFHHPVDRWPKYGLVLSGLGLMAALALYL